MVLRFFAFIWGAILLTLFLVVALITVLRADAPEHLSRAIEVDIVRQQLEYIAQTEGAEATEKAWQRIAPAHPWFAVSADPGCERANLARDRSGNCLAIEDRRPAPSIFDSIKPLVPSMTIGALVSFIGALFLSQWLSRPIRTIDQGLKALAGGNFETRIQPRLRTSNNELVELGHAFDHAAARLKELTEGRNRLFHDISHEIRSPLARLRAAVGILEQNPSRYDSMLEQMKTDIHRLNHLVDEVLTLARFDESQKVLHTDLLDLVDIIEHIVADANLEGEQRGVTVRYSGVEKLELSANAELLHRALENIVRNALIHSPDNGHIELSGAVADTFIILQIRDEGPGVASDDLKRIFNPFERVGETARSKGVGLGLAITARAVEIHGGQITATDGPGKGLTITIRLPMVLPPEVASD